MCAQIETKITQNIAQPGSSKPQRLRHATATTNCVEQPPRCRIHFQISATTTGDSSTG